MEEHSTGSTIVSMAGATIGYDLVDSVSGLPFSPPAVSSCDNVSRILRRGNDDVAEVRAAARLPLRCDSSGEVALPVPLHFNPICRLALQILTGSLLVIFQKERQRVRRCLVL
jgi:hypothetical protein